MLSIITAAEAAGLVGDADTLIVGGNGGTGAAESILDALEQLFDKLGLKLPVVLTTRQTRRKN